ncbi:glycoside hydrolase family 3 N-terminal domain-containing protein [Cryomorpha ignava]|nr:glycoside hydrolase family 3 N-terminal domain-containing protein [Cryomorpha ignava]
MIKSLCMASSLLVFSGIAFAQKAKTPKPITQSETEFIDGLMARMTIEEKIGQLTLYTSGWDVTGPSLNPTSTEELREGRVGGLFNAHGVAYVRGLQDIAVKETRLGIPLLFGYDVIHGHQTIFPTPLGEASSWDLDLIQESARLSAIEAAASGLNWTFNPMVDIARDPRWGRVMEGSGEDTYLGSKIGVAKVIGYQGDNLADPLTLLACVKHFAAYGAPLAGRDYGTVDMSERTLREYYLPPYKAAIDAGAATVMTSFNEVDGVPATGSSWLLTDILRNEWGFKGFVVTDYTAINEILAFGVVPDLKAAGELALKSGVDMDMEGSVFNRFTKQSLEEGKVTEAEIDQAVRRILEAKWKAGLFANPYLYLDEKREKMHVRSQVMKDHALNAGKRSIVLLKNEAVNDIPLLPISKSVKTIAVIGPVGDNQLDVMGSWHASGIEADVVTVLAGIRKAVPNALVTYTQGCGFEGDDTSGFAAARTAASKADIVIMALGENYVQSGEAASRTDIRLPGQQEALVSAIMATGKPVIALIAAGRPLDLSALDEQVPAIVNTWQLGTMHGVAVADVLFGDYNPSAKITMTFPRNVGQIPLFYNTKNVGRPIDLDQKYTSKYIDAPNTPLYPFGYGLSYTTFAYSDLTVSQPAMAMADTISVSVTVTNTGKMAGEEVVQLYVKDMVGSVTRPVRELKGFDKIMLAPGESKTVTFRLSANDLAFYNQNMDFKAEPGEFEVFIGGDSNASLSGGFELK